MVNKEISESAMYSQENIQLQYIHIGYSLGLHLLQDQAPPLTFAHVAATVMHADFKDSTCHTAAMQVLCPALYN